MKIFQLFLVVLFIFSVKGDDLDQCENTVNGAYPFTPLDYAYDALEPYIIQHTMELHHDKHYKAYTDKCNDAIADTPLTKLNIQELLRENSEDNVAIRNNCGGYHNHCIFWKFMQGNGASKPSGQLEELISNAFGSFEDFQEKFDSAASGVFGSGWAWLVLQKNAGGDQFLNICTTPNQESPIWNQNSRDNKCSGEIILTLDVWEHAYYLQYFNVRNDYISNWWSVVNWEYAEQRLQRGLKNLQQQEVQKSELL